MATTKIFLGNVRGPQGKDGKDGANGRDGSRGPKGDPFRYEDFTDAQIDEISKKLLPDIMLLSVSNICYVASVTPASNVGADGDICIIRG